HVGNDTTKNVAAERVELGREVAFGAVVILYVGVEGAEQRAHRAAGCRVGFDHCNDGTGDAHRIIIAEKKAATATKQGKPEPQGGLGAVDSPVGRGRMAGIFPSERPQLEVALVPKLAQCDRM